MIRRDGKSEFVRALIVGKRGNILKVAQKGNPADTDSEAKNVLNKFDKSEDIPNEYIEKHKERIEEGHEPKDVMTDFFKGLNEVKSKNKLTIRTAKIFRQNGIFKVAERNVYQDLQTGDFWKITEDKKSVVRMFKEVNGVVEK